MSDGKDDLPTGKKHVLHLKALEDITIQLLDTEGKPEKGRARLTLPDGNTVEKDLDAEGKIEAKKVLPGMVKLEFPVAKGRDPSIELGDVDVTVLDDEDEPVRNQSFKITFADGTSKDGKTGPDGRIVLHHVPKGEYTLELTGARGELRRPGQERP